MPALAGTVLTSIGLSKGAEQGAMKVDEWTGAKAAREEEEARQKRTEEAGNQQIADDKKRLQDLEDEKKREKDRLGQVALREAQRKRQRAMAQSKPAGSLLGGGSSMLGGTGAKPGAKTLLGF